MDTLTRDSQEVLMMDGRPIRPQNRRHETPWMRACREGLLLFEAFAHRVRNRLIRACLEFAQYLEDIEAAAIAREARSKKGPRNWLLGPPPPAPRLPQPGRASPFAVAISVRSRRERIDFDEAPTETYHPIPSPER